MYSMVTPGCDCDCDVLKDDKSVMLTLFLLHTVHFLKLHVFFAHFRSCTLKKYTYDCTMH